jgi:hypothetical protein
MPDAPSSFHVLFFVFAVADLIVHQGLAASTTETNHPLLFKHIDFAIQDTRMDWGIEGITAE